MKRYIQGASWPFGSGVGTVLAGAVLAALLGGVNVYADLGAVKQEVASLADYFRRIETRLEAIDTKLDRVTEHMIRDEANDSRTGKVGP